MSFQLLSPGVNVSEIDLTTGIPVVSTSAGATVGQFVWGAVETRQLISSEVTLANRLGKPDTNTFLSFFSASNFLAYGNQLYVTRAANTTTKNAVANTAAAAPLQIKNEEVYELNYYTGQGDFGEFAARYPGALGNTLKVGVCGSANVFSSNVFQQTSSVATANVSAAAQTVIGFIGASANAALSFIKVGDYVKFNTNPYIQVTATANGSSNGGGGNITLASGLTVAITAADPIILRKWEYADQFDGAPGTSDYADARSGVNDELHIIVLDEDGVISGTQGYVLEKYPFVSKGTDAKSNDGSSIYYPTVLFNSSRWVYFGDHDPLGTNWGNVVASTTFTDVTVAGRFSLTGGTDQLITDGDLERGWDLYRNAEVVDVSLLVSGEADATVQQYIIDNIVNVRKDCMVFLSPSRASVVNNSGNEATDTVTYRNTLSSTSYAEIDCNWKYQYDKYNDTYRYLPLNADVAGTCVYTDTTRDPWYSPAGFDRGQIKNAVKLAWNPVQADRDLLYKNGINSIVSFPGEGVLLYGDKTMLSKPSAFDRINVRRLFIVLEKAISRAAKYSLFEFNDEFTRAAFVSLVEPYLRDVMGRRGITDYRVVCDTTNNTPTVIDANQFVGDIYVKPARSINGIQLNFVAVRTGVSFDEVVGKF